MKRICITLLAIATVAGLPTPSLAISPYQVELRGELDKLSSRSAKKINLSVRDHQGVRKILLSAKRFKVQAASSQERFFTGRAFVRKGQALPRYARAVSASIYDGKLELTYFGRRQGRAYVARFVEPKNGLNSASLIAGKLGHLPSMFKMPCPLEHAEALPQTVGALALGFGANASALYNPLKVVDVATLADPTFYAEHGSSTNSDILAKLAGASSIFEDDIGLSLNASNQTVQSSSTALTSSTDSNTLLDDFTCQFGYCGNGSPAECPLGTGPGYLDCSGSPYQGSLDSSADLYTLFTGRTLNSSVIGLAYLGTVCQISGGLSFNLIGADGYSVWPYAHLIIAHEYGHSFNAPHSSDSSLMDPVLSPSITNFGTGSRSVITSYVDSYGSCLSDGAPNTNLGITLDSVSYSKSSKKFSYKVSTDNMTTQGVSSCSLSLIGAKTAADALSGSGSATVIDEPHSISSSAELSQFKTSSKALSYKYYTGTKSYTRYFSVKLTCGSETATSDTVKSYKFTKLSSKTTILTTLDKAL